MADRYKKYTDFEDIRFPLMGQKLTASAGRLDYDFEECAVNFSATARYPEEPICVIAQMPHGKKLNTVIRPHLHWVQAENKIPNWLLAYRFYNNGSAVPNFSLATHIGTSAFGYSSGSIMQITQFPHITPPSSETLSAICDMILYRDSQNESGLFAGVDPYTLEAASKEFDCHIELNSPGSRKEFGK